MSNLAANFYRHERQRTRRWIAENTVTNLQGGHLGLLTWSWQDIFRLYKIYGIQLQEYKDIADRFEIDLPIEPKPGVLIRYASGEERFVSGFYAGVVRINGHLKVLDDEIRRRNELIGVMG